MAHLYGVALYYATSMCEFWFTGRSHSRPEPLYFWVYYVGFNLPWAIVPACEWNPVLISCLIPCRRSVYSVYRLHLVCVTLPSAWG